MKTIFLFSSIFYLLGLKVGHKIDVVKSCNPVEKITTKTTAVKEAAKAVYFKDELKLKDSSDSLKNSITAEKAIKEKNRL